MALQINCDESKPYIFISYAHKDSDKVYPILERLEEVGFNIWYDKGIEAGSTWDDNIALHIDNATYFMAFVSENYLASGNCRDEIGYARDLDKDMLLIYLEEVALPSGMAMRLNRNQAVIWNELDDLYKGEDFSKILNAKGIRKTLINGGNIPSPDTKIPDTAAPITVSETIRTGKNINSKIIIISAVAVVIIGLVVALLLLRKNPSSDYDFSNYDSMDYDTEVEFEDEDAKAEKYKDALEAELIGFDYSVVNDAENKESEIVYWAQIKNPNSNVFIEDAILKLTIRGEDGTIINTSEDYYSDILAGDTVSVLGRISSVYDDKNTIPEVTCEVFNTEFGDQKSDAKTMYSAIEFFNISTRPSDYDSLVITGEVNFNTKTDDEYLSAIVLLKQKGKCVFIDTVSLSDVKPGKTQAFSTELYSQVPEFDEIVLLPEKGW